MPWGRAAMEFSQAKCFLRGVFQAAVFISLVSCASDSKPLSVSLQRPLVDQPVSVSVRLADVEQIAAFSGVLERNVRLAERIRADAAARNAEAFAALERALETVAAYRVVEDTGEELAPVLSAEQTQVLLNIGAVAERAARAAEAAATAAAEVAAKQAEARAETRAQLAAYDAKLDWLFSEVGCTVQHDKAKCAETVAEEEGKVFALFPIFPFKWSDQVARDVASGLILAACVGIAGIFTYRDERHRDRDAQFAARDLAEQKLRLEVQSFRNRKEQEEEVEVDEINQRLFDQLPTEGPARTALLKKIVRRGYLDRTLGNHEASPDYFFDLSRMISSGYENSDQIQSFLNDFGRLWVTHTRLADSANAPPRTAFIARPDNMSSLRLVTMLDDASDFARDTRSFEIQSLSASHADSDARRSNFTSSSSGLRSANFSSRSAAQFFRLSFGKSGSVRLRFRRTHTMGIAVAEVQGIQRSSAPTILETKLSPGDLVWCAIAGDTGTLKFRMVKVREAIAASTLNGRPETLLLEGAFEASAVGAPIITHENMVVGIVVAVDPNGLKATGLPLRVQDLFVPRGQLSK